MIEFLVNMYSFRFPLLKFIKLPDSFFLVLGEGRVIFRWLVIACLRSVNSSSRCFTILFQVINLTPYVGLWKNKWLFVAN